jgi:hypothetical protein
MERHPREFFVCFTRSLARVPPERFVRGEGTKMTVDIPSEPHFYRGKIEKVIGQKIWTEGLVLEVESDRFDGMLVSLLFWGFPYCQPYRTVKASFFFFFLRPRPPWIPTLTADRRPPPSTPDSRVLLPALGRGCQTLGDVDSSPWPAPIASIDP